MTTGDLTFIRNINITDCAAVCVDTVEKLLFVGLSGVVNEVRSYRYTDSGSVTFVEAKSYTTVSCQGITADTEKKILFLSLATSGLATVKYDAAGYMSAAVDTVDDPDGTGYAVALDTTVTPRLAFFSYASRGVEVYSYDDSGNLSAMLSSDGTPTIYSTTLDTDLKLMFAGSSTDDLRLYSYTDAGIISYIGNGGVKSNRSNGVAVDTHHGLVFNCNDGLDSYSYTSLALAHVDNITGTWSKELELDTINMLVFWAKGTSGLFVSSYDIDGNLTPVDDDDQGGEANEVALDMTPGRRLVFLANYNHGLEIYRYYSTEQTSKSMNVLDENLYIFGKYMDQVEDDGNLLLREFFPDVTNLFLADYERIFNLSPVDLTVPQRRNQIISAMRQRGGLSKAYFEGIGNALGSGEFTVVLTEGSDNIGFTIHTIESLATALPAKLYDAPFSDGPYNITVTVTGVSASVKLEAMFNRLKPVHTNFDYVYVP